MTTRKAQILCEFKLPALQALLRYLKSKEEQALKSAEYMMAVKQRIVERYQDQLEREETMRQEDELKRMYDLLEMKLITHRDISEDTCMIIDNEKAMTFSKSKNKKDRRCEDPPVKETVLDPVYRYHTSIITDPFEILGHEKPAVNITCDLTGGDEAKETYTKHYKDPNLQRMSEASSVSEMYELAELAVMRTADGCKDLILVTV